ncbi:hypothetical protein A2866_06205 [Candidatus Roizmanbacteria bacterium RIFCSPHIGHO2_01_FULL_39_8]|uniref:Lactamase n=3 Tax=Candidatus Roizmaniibacteriota TaxID=1752723 RepID=A0A1F7GT80_9BACT|nr:MAG: hypothetical protein A2866_06205 [Candidatus Roizmanbacteria bacterium RIFCSPHIGHO2_01_FULL_39_8]OGK28608.1 MAG: hypothetical protein A3C28_03065 [Candidatus Roizmanbacteria bacterium RIFCSPHIGHO2_02_FULL_39_9]OGK37853.1 MAG: hypothetical protein A3F60_02920 [Candidatus Roizmanbacteria bacterium RIFCSPHIGHO2_12_FULL_39_8]
MDIKYFGHSAFFLRSKDAKVVTDPFDPKMTGIKFPKTEADIVTISHQHEDHNYKEGISGTPLFIEMPGEYEKNGVRVTGFQTYHDKKKGEERGENVAYKIEADGISLLHCGDLGIVWEDSFIDQLGEINVLMVPVGGVYTIDANEAIELVKKIEPSLVIPMHYKTAMHSKDAAISPVDEFLKKMAVEAVSPTPKLTIKKEDLLDEMKTVVMEISN